MDIVGVQGITVFLMLLKLVAITPSFLRYVLKNASLEKRLIAELMYTYDVIGKHGRPVKNVSTPVSVQFGLGLIKMELREKENVLEMSTWSRMRWKDEYLSWNPDDYGGVNSIRVAADQIWVPDLMLFNTAEAGTDEREVLAVVRSDGVVSWFPHRIYSSSCAVDVRNFPFDNQTCHMFFGSWTHPLDQMDINLAFQGGVDLSTFQQVYKDASEWDIINVTATRLELPPEDPSYAIINISLSLRRKLMFSTYILTMPAVFLSFLTLVVFWLPPEHADKSALGLTIFSSLLLLLLILVEAAPPTASAIPLLGIYYCFTSVIVIVSIFLSSVVVKIGRKAEERKPMPRWMKKIFVDSFRNCSSSVLRCFTNKQQVTSVNNIESQDKLLHSYNMTVREKTITTTDDNNGQSNVSPSVIYLDKRLKKMQDLLEKVINERDELHSHTSYQNDIEHDWRQLALTMDRFFFVVYLLAIIISLILLFPKF